MINLETINKDILELETMHDTTWNVMERLSWLYTVRDHFKQDHEEESRSFKGDSEFINAINRKDIVKVIAVMDELMDTLAILQPNLYRSVLRRISD